MVGPGGILERKFFFAYAKLIPGRAAGRAASWALKCCMFRRCVEHARIISASIRMIFLILNL